MAPGALVCPPLSSMKTCNHENHGKCLFVLFTCSILLPKQSFAVPPSVRGSDAACTNFHTLGHWLVFRSLSWSGGILGRRSHDSGLLPQSCSTSGPTCCKAAAFVHISVRAWLEWVSFADRQHTRPFTGRKPPWLIYGYKKVRISWCVGHRLRMKEASSSRSRKTLLTEE